MTKGPVLALVHLVLLAALLGGLAWQSLPVEMPDLDEGLRCVSYAPFHRGQSPFDETLTVPRQQIEEDLRALSALTGCVRTYSTDSGLDQVPSVARELGMKVLLGAWIGRDPKKNASDLDRALALANAHRDTVRAIVVGNEVLLRREQTAQQMSNLLDRAHRASQVPITYADVWEFWLKNPELADHVDFVTVHILPFWEDDPVNISRALAHVADVRHKVGRAFAGKSILIGETGWPSAGRQRESSQPSRVNQARYIREFVRQARTEGWDYNLIEAIDQPWKRALEGTVGGHWGLLDADLHAKFPLTGPLPERESLTAPLMGAAAGALLMLLLAGRPWSRLITLTLVGATTGLIAVLHAEHAGLAYARLTDWVALGAVALAALSSALVLTCWPHHQRANDALRGFLLFAAAVAALLLFVDPRYRDFPLLLYLTPAAIYGVTGWSSRFTRAEFICAAVIAPCGTARWLFEPTNPQACAWLLICLALALPVLVRRKPVSP